jgi:hypothetical protein
LGEYSTSLSNYWMAIYTNTAHLGFFYLYDGTHNPLAQSVASLSGWSYIVCVRDVSQGKLLVYINGYLSGTGTDTTTLVPTYSQFKIGQVTGSYSNGLIDDVRVYNRALSAAQIAAMYAGGK